MRSVIKVGGKEFGHWGLPDILRNWRTILAVGPILWVW
jgi:hypothetical protein